MTKHKGERIETWYELPAGNYRIYGAALESWKTGDPIGYGRDEDQAIDDLIKQLDKK